MCNYLVDKVKSICREREVREDMTHKDPFSSSCDWSAESETDKSFKEEVNSVN